MSAPAWQTDELGEEWIETSPSPPTTPVPTETVVRGSVHNKRGSLRSLGHGSVARALPPRRASAMSLPEGRSPSNPYVRNASGMLSPPTSASSDDGRDTEYKLKSSLRSTRSVSAPTQSSAKGTFVVKDGEDTHGKAFPRNAFVNRDMFSALPLEKMFEPPSSPMAILEEEEPTSSGSTSRAASSTPSVAELALVESPSPIESPASGESTPSRSTPTATIMASTTTAPRALSLSPHWSGSTPSSGSEGRRVSHQYTPAHPSRLSKSMTPSDNSFSTTTANSSRVATPAPDGEEDMSVEHEHDSLLLPVVPDDTVEEPTHHYDDTAQTHPYDDSNLPTNPYDHTNHPTNPYDNTDHPTIPYDEHTTQDERGVEDEPQTGTTRIRVAQSQAGTTRIRDLESQMGTTRIREESTEAPSGLHGKYPFNFSAPVGNARDVDGLDRSETPEFEPSLAPLAGGEPSHSTLNEPPELTNVGLRLFRNGYDTYTREQLSAMVDSLANHPSPPATRNTIPRRADLREWSPEASGTPDAYRSASYSNSLTPESATSDSHSSKRIKLARPEPRGPTAIRDWRAQGNAMLERIRVTDPDFSSTSASDSRSLRSGSAAWTDERASAIEDFGRPTFDYGHPSLSPDPEPVVKSNPSTASSNYLHRAEDMMSRIKSRVVSPTSTTDNPTDSSPRNEEAVLSETSRVSSLVNTDQSSEAERHIPRHEFSWKGSGKGTSPLQSAVSSRTGTANSQTATAASARRGMLEGTGRPPEVREDLNRFVSATTVASATTMSTSFVKHRGPKDPTPSHMTMIRPGDVQGVVPNRIGKMYYDQETHRWVRSSRDALTRVSEGAESQRISEDSQDVFAGFDSTSPSIHASQAVTYSLERRGSRSSLGRGFPISSPENGFHDCVGFTDSSPEKGFHDSSPVKGFPSYDRTSSPEGGFSSPEKGFASPEKDQTSSSSPEKYALDSLDRDDPQATPRARPRLNHSISCPVNGTPIPLRSALRNANGSTPISAMKKRAAWHADLTPAREQREASAAPSSGSNRRSVSFSDGYVIAQHIEAERAEWSRLDGKGHFERYERTDIMEESSIAPSMRTRRIQQALDGMADLQITDIDDDDDEMPDPSPSKPARSSSSASSCSSAALKRPSALSEASEEHSDSTVPITAFRSFRSFRRGGAGDQTFLTECSFGVAHDRLVQLITDVQPFEPHWETLKAIDLSDKGVESLARLKEFLPRLDEANLNDNQIDYLSGVPSSVRKLRVAGNCLTSLTSVSHLRNLHFLDISRNQLDSVSQLDCLHHLRELVIDSNQITDLKGIMGIDCLVKLSVADNAIEELDLTDAKWESLESLDLSRNKIQSIRGLERLKSLTTLKLDANALVTLEPASSMSSLRILRVSDNGLTSLDVSLFPRLRTLFADNNALPGLTRSGPGGHRIENLSLRSQDVASFSLNPEDIQAVKRLYVSGNTLPPNFLSTPVYSLVYLEAIACQLSDWPENLVAHAPNLRVLNVNYNFIETLDGLAGLTRLTKLMAVGCRLGARGNAVRGLQGLEGLEELDLRMNPATLSFYLPILLPSKKEKGRGGKLKETESRGAGTNNPAWAARDSQYRHQLPDEWYSRRLFYRGLVFGKCPQLRILDGVGVTSGEKDKAAALLDQAQGVVGQSGRSSHNNSFRHQHYSSLYKMSGRINQPNRIETWLLQEDEKRLTITEDPKIPNAATVIVRAQDHTLGNMLRAQLLLDPTVLFSGYKVAHPLENVITIKIQTDERSNPADALKRACTQLINQTINVKKQFQDQARNIEMGMGPEAAPQAAGGYDPYGDGFGSSTQAGGAPQGGDVYDF
ncbi:hypothetical protein CcaverHIS631_0600630 [Cutaneotrichosporon cavernicola]|nr:hypothetical protein CcaverHIS631_0600630 [Cutaneotrichosporon cavernicola]BEJ09148.1 hypothetical protein CcaverHIS641_0600630 [Cutaneotrichosporon cavernicola]